MTLEHPSSRPARPGRTTLALLAVALVAAPGLAQAQADNPWRAQTTLQPQFAPAEPQANMVPAPPQGTYAPQNLEATLSGMQPPAPPRIDTPPDTSSRSTGTLETPSTTVPPTAGAVVPPYAGLPLAGGYNYGYVPATPVQPNSTTTIVVPYSGYPATGYPGSGYPTTGYGNTYGYPNYGYPGYGSYGMPSWGDGRSGNNWNSWSPGGYGFPMGGFSPFSFW